MADIGTRFYQDEANTDKTWSVAMKAVVAGAAVIGFFMLINHEVTEASDPVGEVHFIDGEIPLLEAR